MSRHPGRAGRVAGGVAVVAALAAVTVAGLRVPEPASAGAGGSVVAVPPTATTLVCPGPVVLAGDGTGDAAFDPTPVPTTTTQRVLAPSGTAGTGTSVTALAGGPLLLGLDAGTTAGALADVAGPTVVRAEPSGGRPAVVGAASASVTAQGDLRGLAAATCRQPSASVWLVGGSTEIGSSALLVVANPGRTPAEVSLALWGPTGALEAAGASTFLVAPGEQRAVLLEGVAAEQRRIAVHVTAAGGLVTAHLQDSRLDGFTPAGTDLVTAGREPSRRQVVGGLVVPASDVEDPDTAVVRVLAPGEDRAAARLTVLGAEGPVPLPGAESLDLGPGEVTDVSLAGLPPGAYTVVVDADVPVLAGAMLTREGDPLELGDVPTLERAWSAAAPGTDSGVVAVPPGVAGTVVLAAVPSADDLADLRARQQADVEGEEPTGASRDEPATTTGGGAVTGVLSALGPDGAVLGSQDVSLRPGTTLRVDSATLAPALEVAAFRLERPTDDDADAGAGEATGLTWAVLVSSGVGPAELLSVLTPAPAPDAQPDVVVRPGDRLGLD